MNVPQQMCPQKPANSVVKWVERWAEMQETEVRFPSGKLFFFGTFHVSVHTTKHSVRENTCWHEEVSSTCINNWFARTLRKDDLCHEQIRTSDLRISVALRPTLYKLSYHELHAFPWLYVVPVVEQLYWIYIYGNLQNKLAYTWIRSQLPVWLVEITKIKLVFDSMQLKPCYVQLVVRMTERSKAPDLKAWPSLKNCGGVSVLVHECGRGFESHFWQTFYICVTEFLHSGNGR